VGKYFSCEEKQTLRRMQKVKKFKNKYHEFGVTHTVPGRQGRQKKIPQKKCRINK
jgi:hypothetical protein